MKTEAKTFDCVEMMHEGALRIYEATKGMSIEEEWAYWQQRKTELRAKFARRSDANKSQE